MQGYHSHDQKFIFKNLKLQIKRTATAANNRKTI